MKYIGFKMKFYLTITILFLFFISYCHSQDSYILDINKNWKYKDLHNFLNTLGSEDIVYLAVSLNLVKEEDVKKYGEYGVIWRYSGKREALIKEIEKSIIWLSSNITTYYFKSNQLDYHEIVKWAAEKMGVEKTIIDSQSTFIIEQAIFEKLFIDIWDKLTENQRLELLKSINKEGELTEKQINAMITGTGTTALASLAATVYFSGFTFYTTMSTTLATVAGYFGITLPFSIYTGTSTVVGFLSGPVGWTIIGVGAIITTVWAGSANEKKIAAIILQIHILKAKALKDAGKVIPNINKKFLSIGDFNGDKESDILVFTNYNSELRIFYNNFFYNKFKAKEISNNWLKFDNSKEYFLDTGDFNGDGKDEILLFYKPNNQVQVWFNSRNDFRGHGSGKNWLAIDNSKEVFLGAGDFNGDGKDDLLFLNKSNNQLQVWFNSRNDFRGYGSGKNWLAIDNSKEKFLGIGDFNGDGKDDILLLNKPSNQLQVWFNNQNHDFRGHGSGENWSIFEGKNELCITY